jgi:aminopeptidase N
LWAGRDDPAIVQEQFDDVMSIDAGDDFWSVVVADPGPTGIFSDPVYDRGAATLHALRQKVGDEAFFAATQSWVDTFDGANGTTEDFRAVFEAASGQDLTAFFDTWVRRPFKPTNW